MTSILNAALWRDFSLLLGWRHLFNLSRQHHRCWQELSSLPVTGRDNCFCRQQCWATVDGWIL